MGDVDCLEFHPNIHYVATGSNDKSIRLWSTETGSCVRILFTVPGAIRSLKFSRAGYHLLAGNEYGQVVLFDVNKAVPLEVFSSN